MNSCNASCGHAVLAIGAPGSSARVACESSPCGVCLAPTIRTTFDVITPESAAHGDVSDSGWEDERGESWDEADELTPAEWATKWLRNRGPVEPSSSAFHPGLWYTQSDADIDYRTGAEKRLAFHLVNFTETDQEAIFDDITQR